MSSSGWSKVAAGARLVASAVAKQGAGEAGVAAQRATHHALELSLRARQTAFVAAQQEVWGSSPTTHESDKSHGTSPYESQLRKKHQKQQEQEVNGNSEAAPNLNGTKTANKAVAARSLNPYLLHQEHGEMDTVNNNYREQDSVSSYQSTPSPEQTLGGESNETIITTAKSAFPSIEDTNTPIHLKEGRAVPSSRLGRAVGFASLGVGLAWGSTTELASRWLGSGGSTSVGSPVASNDNADRLASTLCRMRGAALKMGQMLSIQDESLCEFEFFAFWKTKICFFGADFLFVF